MFYAIEPVYPYVNVIKRSKMATQKLWGEVWGNREILQLWGIHKPPLPKQIPRLPIRSVKRFIQSQLVSPNLYITKLQCGAHPLYRLFQLSRQQHNLSALIKNTRVVSRLAELETLSYTQISSY